MKKKLLTFLAVPIVFAASSAQAAVLNFDSPVFPANTETAGYSYNGFYWFNLQRITDYKNNSKSSKEEAYSNPYALSSNTNTKYSYIQLENPDDNFYFNGFQIKSLSEKSNLTLNGYSSTGNLLFTSTINNPGKNYFGFNGKEFLYNGQPINNFQINKLEISWLSEKNAKGINLDDFDYSPVPEPSSMFLGVLGLSGILCFIRKKHRA
jgi:hypothetical protein